MYEVFIMVYLFYICLRIKKKSVYLFFFLYFGISSKKCKLNLIEDRLLDDDFEVVEIFSRFEQNIFNGEENDVCLKDVDEDVFLMR